MDKYLPVEKARGRDADGTPEPDEVARLVAGAPPEPDGTIADPRALEAWRRRVPDLRPAEVDRLLPIARKPASDRVVDLVRAYRAGVADGQGRSRTRGDW